MRTLFARLVFACFLLGGIAPAHALDIPTFDLKIGIRGGASVPLLLDPADSGLYPNVPYTTYYGVGYNFGLNLHFRMFDILSIESGWYRSYDNLSGTIELNDVREASSDGRLRKQEFLQRFRTASDHIPVVLQVAIPISVARPFASVGLDFTVNRLQRRYNVERTTDPVPGIDEDGLTAELAAEWAESERGQNALTAALAPDPGLTVGIIAGLGVNIALDKVELPIELRAVLTPSAGGALNDRGEFPSASQVVSRGTTDTGTRYNDVWTTQFFILVGLDYLIF